MKWLLHIFWYFTSFMFSHHGNLENYHRRLVISKMSTSEQMPPWCANLKTYKAFWMTQTASPLSCSSSINIWIVSTHKPWNICLSLHNRLKHKFSQVQLRLWSCLWRWDSYLKRISSLWVLCVQVWDEQRSHLSHDLGRHLAVLHILGISRWQEERAYMSLSTLHIQHLPVGAWFSLSYQTLRLVNIYWTNIVFKHREMQSQESSGSVMSVSKLQMIGSEVEGTDWCEMFDILRS